MDGLYQGGNRVDHIVMVLVVLFLAGLGISLVPTVLFHYKVQQVHCIDHNVLRKTMYWIVAGSIWSGLCLALFILVTKDALSPSMSAMSVGGMIAILLGAPVFCTITMVVSFLDGVDQLRMRGFPVVRDQDEMESNAYDPRS